MILTPINLFINQLKTKANENHTKKSNGNGRRSGNKLAVFLQTQESIICDSIRNKYNPGED